MKILYILKHNPYGVGGGCKATFLYFMAFKEIFDKADFDVLTCEEYVKDFPPSIVSQINVIGIPRRNVLAKVVSPFTGILHRYQNKAKNLLNITNYDFCIFDHNAIAGSLIRYVKKKGIKSLVINHNLEANYYRDNTHSTIKRFLILPQVVKNEKNSYYLCDYNLFLTSEDRIDFCNHYGYSSTKVLTRYIYEYEDINKSIISESSSDSFCITGSLNNIQNIDGIEYFIETIYPLLPVNVNITISGKDPCDKMVSRLKKYPNINLIANPTNMDEIVSNCSIYLCPTKLGSGIKVRISDALRNGLPVIAHKVSARGYSQFIKAGFMISYDDKETFVIALEQMRNWIKQTPDYKRVIRDYYFEECNFEKSTKEIAIFLKDIIHNK